MVEVDGTYDNTPLAVVRIPARDEMYIVIQLNMFHACVYVCVCRYVCTCVCMGKSNIFATS